MSNSPYPGDGIMLAVSVIAALLAVRGLMKSRARDISQELKRRNRVDFCIGLGVTIFTLAAVFENHSHLAR